MLIIRNYNSNLADAELEGATKLSSKSNFSTDISNFLLVSRSAQEEKDEEDEPLAVAEGKKSGIYLIY